MDNAKKMTATVYKARNGRRYLTQRAALNASARHLLKRKCECEGCDVDDLGRVTFGGYRCEWHGDSGALAYHKTLPRLVRWLKWCDSREERAGAADAIVARGMTKRESAKESK